MNLAVPDAPRLWGRREGDIAFRSRGGRLYPLAERFAGRIEEEFPVEKAFPIVRGREVMFEVCLEPLIKTADGFINLVDEIAFRAIVRVCREHNYLPRHALPVGRQEALKTLRRVLAQDESQAIGVYDPTRPKACSVRSYVLQYLPLRVIEQLEGRRLEGRELTFGAFRTLAKLDAFLYRRGPKRNSEGGPIDLPDAVPAPDNEMRELIGKIFAREDEFRRAAGDQVPNSRLFSSRNLRSFEAHWPAMGLILSRDHRVFKLSDFERADAPPEEAAKDDEPVAILSKNLPQLNWHQIAPLIGRTNGAQVERALTSFVVTIAQSAPAFGALAHDIAVHRHQLAQLLSDRARGVARQHRATGDLKRFVERFEERLAVMRRLFLFVDPALVGFSTTNQEAI